MVFEHKRGLIWANFAVIRRWIPPIAYWTGTLRIAGLMVWTGIFTGGIAYLAGICRWIAPSALRALYLLQALGMVRAGIRAGFWALLALIISKNADSASAIWF